MSLKLAIFLAALSLCSSAHARADSSSISPDQWVGLAKLAVDNATKVHGSEPHFQVSSVEVGRIARAGKAFDGMAVNFTGGEDVTSGLPVARLPDPLRFDWVTRTGTAGEFTQQELLSSLKIAVDQFAAGEVVRSSKRIVSYRVFLSQSEYPVRLRLAWRAGGGGNVAGEFEYFCHKPGRRLECHRVN